LHLLPQKMACAGPEILWNDFCSHCPGLPEPYDTFVKRLPRDDEKIAKMENEALLFLAEVDELREMIDEEFGGTSVTEKRLRQSIALVEAKKKRESGPQPVVAAIEECGDLGVTEEDARA